MANNNHVETWKKIAVITRALYMQSQEGSNQTTLDGAPPTVLDKDSIIVFSALLAEQKINDHYIWDCLQKDLIKILDGEKLNYSAEERKRIRKEEEIL